MLAYRYNEKGQYIGQIECQIDPVASQRENKVVYLVPGNATLHKPLPARDGFDVVYTNGVWKYQEQPKKPELPEPTEKEKIQDKISEYKSKLFETDYVVLKIAEGRATAEDYAETIAAREEWREAIRELEKELANAN